MARIDRLKEYAKATGPSGISAKKKNLEFWSERASQNSESDGPTKPNASQAPQDFESKLAGIQGIPENAKTWLRKHPEFVNDTAMNEKIGAAHTYLERQIARTSFTATDMTDAQKEYQYLQNKRRMLEMKADGRIQNV
jgi:hypothetical protein